MPDVNSIFLGGIPANTRDPPPPEPPAGKGNGVVVVLSVLVNTRLLLVIAAPLNVPSMSFCKFVMLMAWAFFAVVNVFIDDVCDVSVFPCVVDVDCNELISLPWVVIEVPCDVVVVCKLLISLLCVVRDDVCDAVVDCNAPMSLLWLVKEVE